MGQLKNVGFRVSIALAFGLLACSQQFDAARETAPDNARTEVAGEAAEDDPDPLNESADPGPVLSADAPSEDHGSRPWKDGLIDSDQDGVLDPPDFDSGYGVDSANDYPTARGDPLPPEAEIAEKASPEPVPDASTPAQYATLKPEAPIKFRQPGIISAATSARLSRADLTALLLERRQAGIVEAIPDSLAARSLSGEVETYGLPYLRADISCLLLNCARSMPADDGVRNIRRKDPAIWEWTLSTDKNEEAEGSITISIQGAPSRQGPFEALDTLPPIRVAIPIDPISEIWRLWLEYTWEILAAIGSAVGAICYWLFYGRQHGPPG